MHRITRTTEVRSENVISSESGGCNKVCFPGHSEIENLILFLSGLEVEMVMVTRNNIESSENRFKQGVETQIGGKPGLADITESWI